LIGNLTRDPELRYTPNGAAVCTFGLATNRTYLQDGEKKEEVDFHRLVSWNKLAELCNQLLKKGNKVFISGRLQTRTWEGQDGQSRTVTEIVIEDMILLSPKNEGPVVSAPEEGINIEDLPVVNEAPAKPEAKEEKEKEKKQEEEEPKEKKTGETPQESVADDDLPF